MSWLLAIWQALSAASKWLLERPVLAVLLMLALHVSVHRFVIDPRLRGERDTALAERDAEIQAHGLTKQTYRLAQAEAAALDRARLARVEAEQREITDDIVADYESRLGDVRARAERLRQQLGAAGEHPAGSARSVYLPAAGDAAGRAAEAAGDRGLSIEERLIATEQALQLQALIEWTTRQAAVSMTPAEAILP